MTEYAVYRLIDDPAKVAPGGTGDKIFPVAVDPTDAAASSDEKAYPAGEWEYLLSVPAAYEDQYAVIEWCPAQDIVLAQRPVLVKAFFEIDKIAALVQGHALGQPRQLIQVWGEIGNAPNPGLREIIKFHLGPPSLHRK